MPSSYFSYHFKLNFSLFSNCWPISLTFSVCSCLKKNKQKSLSITSYGLMVSKLSEYTIYRNKVITIWGRVFPPKKENQLKLFVASKANGKECGEAKWKRSEMETKRNEMERCEWALSFLVNNAGIRKDSRSARPVSATHHSTPGVLLRRRRRLRLRRLPTVL